MAEHTPSEIRRMESQIQSEESSLDRKRAELKRIRDYCQHNWGETVADHLYTEGYTIPGDKPGTMGSDFRGPTYVSSKTEYRWKRVCKKCGKIEHTTQTEDHVTKTPKF